MEIQFLYMGLTLIKSYKRGFSISGAHYRSLLLKLEYVLLLKEITFLPAGLPVNTEIVKLFNLVKVNFDIVSINNFRRRKMFIFVYCQHFLDSAL